jgi:hypothetical protein
VVKLEESKKILEMLKEADFNILDLSECMDELDNYFTASEMARRLDVRLDIETMTKALTELGYKTYYEKIGLPSNPENSAVVLKYIEDEKTGEKDYYIQCLWDKEVLPAINEKIMNNVYFEPQKQEIESNNNIKREELLSNFNKLDTYLVMSVKKTGFNLKKDFIIYISYILFDKKENTIVNSGYILVDDEIDEEKIERYTSKNEITDMSPFDYISLPLPSMDDFNPHGEFKSRLDSLREIYKVSKGKDIIFANIQEELFINELFNKEEDISDEFRFSSIKGRTFYFQELVDWLESKESFKIKDIYKRYGVLSNKGDGFKRESMMLNEAIIKFLKRHANTI